MPFTKGMLLLSAICYCYMKDNILHQKYDLSMDIVNQKFMKEEIEGDKRSSEFRGRHLNTSSIPKTVMGISASKK